MKTNRKGYELCRAFVLEARSRGLGAQTVPMSGHQGKRGGVDADIVLVVPGDSSPWRIEAKSWGRGVSSGVIEACLGRTGIQAVLHKRARGQMLVSLAAEDFLDLVAGAEGEGK